MKHFCLLLFIFIASVSLAQTNRNDNQCKEVSEPGKSSWLRTQSPTASSAINNYDLVYHQCNWEIDPAVDYIKGNIKTIFKPTTTNFNQIEFDLEASMTVDSVMYHSSKIAFTRQSGDILQIAFPSNVPINTLDSLRVYYQGKPVSDGFGSFVQSAHNGTPIIWTLSEPYGAKTWWPCKQNLVDKIDSIDIIVKTPQANRVGSNGLLISELNLGSDKIYHWKSRYPIAAYLVAIAVTNYVSYSDYVPLKTSTLQVLNYVYPENLDSAKIGTAEIVKIIHMYDSLLIDYPFAKEKYGHAQFGWGGGEEHQTMTFVVAFTRSLLAHECAHQWFGDHITCGSWEDIWLNEGFASYFEWLTTERFDNANWVFGLPGIIKIITALPGGSVLCDDTTQVSRIFDGRLTYTKGAFLLRMLRWKLGDADFFAALKNYLNDVALKGRYAKTPQLIKHFETASGKDLSGFFNQWYYKQGYPSYHVLWEQAGSSTSFTLSQTQSHPSVSFFEMPVALKFVGEKNDTTLVFDNTYSGQSYNCTINFEVVRVYFDPEIRILSAQNTVVGFNDEDLKNASIVLYPNPAGTSLRISGIPKGGVLQNLTITNAFGQIIYSDDSISVIPAGEIQVNTELLAKGVYIITLHTNLGKKHLRFLKE